MWSSKEKQVKIIGVCKRERTATFGGNMMEGYTDMEAAIERLLRYSEAHRRQPRFRETNTTEEGSRPEGIICGDT
jgi:hypothetical protein